MYIYKPDKLLNVQQAVEIVQIWIRLIKIAIKVEVCDEELEREAAVEDSGVLTDWLTDWSTHHHGEDDGGGGGLDDPEQPQAGELH